MILRQYILDINYWIEPLQPYSVVACRVVLAVVHDHSDILKLNVKTYTHTSYIGRYNYFNLVSIT